MKESLQDEVVLIDVPLRAFKLVMRYIYTRQLRLKDLEPDTITEVLGIAHLYGFTKLETSLRQYLRESISFENVCAIYSKAHSLQLGELCDLCHRFILVDPVSILRSESFYDLSEAVLCYTLSQDTFYAEEIEIFKAIAKWCAKRPGEEHSDVLKVIRLPLIETKDLATVVKESGLFPTDLIFDAIKTRECQKEDLDYRGFLVARENLASPDFGALELVKSFNSSFRVQTTGVAYEAFVGSMVRAAEDANLIVALEKPYFVNQIEIEQKGGKEFCGFVLTSVDLVSWSLIGLGGPVAKLNFSPRVVRYVRIFKQDYCFFELAAVKVCYLPPEMPLM